MEASFFMEEGRFIFAARGNQDANEGRGRIASAQRRFEPIHIQMP